jgi:hypothetical protein
MLKILKSLPVTQNFCSDIDIGGGAIGQEGANAPPRFCNWGQCPPKISEMIIIILGGGGFFKCSSAARPK